MPAVVAASLKGEGLQLLPFSRGETAAEGIERVHCRVWGSGATQLPVDTPPMRYKDRGVGEFLFFS